MPRTLTAPTPLVPHDRPTAADRNLPPAPARRTIVMDPQNLTEHADDSLFAELSRDLPDDDPTLPPVPPEESEEDAEAVPAERDVNAPEILDRNWKVICLGSPSLPGGILTIHRPTRREEIAIRGELRAELRTIGINPDDVDTFGQNQTYMHFLLKHCQDEPEAVIDWLAFDAPTRLDAMRVALVYEEVMQWLLTFQDE